MAASGYQAEHCERGRRRKDNQRQGGALLARYARRVTCGKLPSAFGR
jgi:hypothetical protein